MSTWVAKQREEKPIVAVAEEKPRVVAVANVEDVEPFDVIRKRIPVWTDPHDGHVLTDAEIRIVVDHRNKVILDSIERALRAAEKNGLKFKDREALLTGAATLRAHDMLNSS